MKNFMISLLCFLGLHNWSKWSDTNMGEIKKIVGLSTVGINAVIQKKACRWCNRVNIRRVG